MNRIVLGLVGYSGAGKGTVTQYLHDKKSFSVMSLSDIARHEALKAKVNLENRKDLHIFSNQLRKKFGNDVFAKKLLQEMKNLKSQQFVIDGIRHPGEIHFLKLYFPDLIILAVNTDMKRRFDRLLKRKRQLDPVTFSEFLASEKIEKGNPCNITAPQQQNQACVEMADEVINNNGSREDLYRQLNHLLIRIGV